MSGPRPVAVAVALLVAAVAWNAWSAARDGWAPEGDSAAVVVRSHDVLSLDPPLLGNPTTAGGDDGPGLHHPGPLEFVVLALPVRLVGGGGDGALLGAVLVAAASIATIGWLVRRRGGTVLALWVLAGVGALVWSLGDEIVHDVYNPHILLLPLAALVVALWSAGSGDRVALPVAVVAASFVAQSHALYALVAAIVGVAVVGAAILVVRPPARWWWASVALGVVLWLPPLVAELRPGPSNLAGLLGAGAGGEGSDFPAAGIGFGTAGLADTLLGGRWLDRHPDPVALALRPSAALQVLAVALVAALGAAGLSAHRRGRRSAGALALAAVVACVASVAVAARLPGGVPLFEVHNHRHWWVTGAITWVAAAWLVADALRHRLARVLSRARVALVAAPLVVAALAVAWAPSIERDRGSVSFGAVAHLTDEVAAALPDDDGPWLVTASGPQAFLSVQPGVVAGLVLRDVDVRVGPAEGPAMGDHRVVDGPVAGTVLVASDDDPPPVPDGYVLVARFDSVADAERRGHTDAVLFGEPQQLAVFLAVGATPDGG